MARKPRDAFGTPLAADAIYIATTTLSAGLEVIKEGERLRGSNALVREYSDRFVPDGTPRSEWPPDPDIEQLYALRLASNAEEKALRIARVGESERVHEPPPEATLIVKRQFFVRLGDKVVAFDLGERVVEAEWLRSVVGDRLEAAEREVA